MTSHAFRAICVNCMSEIETVISCRKFAAFQTFCSVISLSFLSSVNNLSALDFKAVRRGSLNSLNLSRDALNMSLSIESFSFAYFLKTVSCSSSSLLSSSVSV